MMRKHEDLELFNGQNSERITPDMALSQLKKAYDKGLLSAVEYMTRCDSIRRGCGRGMYYNWGWSV